MIGSAVFCCHRTYAELLALLTHACRSDTLLDQAMERLGQSDRDAMVLRYFQNKSLREVALALGVEERAAYVKRLSSCRGRDETGS